MSEKNCGQGCEGVSTYQELLAKQNPESQKRIAKKRVVLRQALILKPLNPVSR